MIDIQSSIDSKRNSIESRRKKKGNNCPRMDALNIDIDNNKQTK